MATRRRTRALLDAEQDPDTTPECVHERDTPTSTLRVWSGRERHFKCSECLCVFWYDGPSLLDPKDPMRKLRYSDRLIKVSPEGVEVLSHT